MDSCIRAARAPITKGANGHERTRGEGETTFAFGGNARLLFVRGERAGAGANSWGIAAGGRGRAAAGGLRVGGRPAHHSDQFSTIRVYAWDLHFCTSRAWGDSSLALEG